MRVASGGDSALIPAAMRGIMLTASLTPAMLYHTNAKPVARCFSVTLPASVNIVLMAATSLTATEGRHTAMTQAERDRHYLAGVSVATDMLRSGMIDEADYSALETEMAAKFLPLFRYEKPCFSATLLITQTGERRG